MHVYIITDTCGSCGTGELQFVVRYKREALKFIRNNTTSRYDEYQLFKVKLGDWLGGTEFIGLYVGGKLTKEYEV